MTSVVSRSVVSTLAALMVIGVGFAQTPAGPTLARVKAKPAVVKGAPGDLSPETGTLEPGQTVTVVSAEGNDWLAIQPPYGSISWISALMVEPQGQPGPDGQRKPPFNAIVRADQGAPAVLRAGAVGQNRPLAVQRTRLPEGTIVQVIGAKVKAKADGDELETSWYPIVAPVDDYRFVRKEAVEATGTPAAIGYVVKAGATSEKALPGAVPPSDPTGRRDGDWTLTVPGASGPGGSKRDNFPNYHPTFREAEQARGNGDLKKAEQLYRQVADEVSHDGPNKDVDLANLCYDRIFLMKKGTNGGGDWGSTAWKPSETNPLPGTAPPTPAAPPTPRAEVPRAEPPRQEKRGKGAEGFLKATKFQISSRPVFVLTDNKGYVRYYVTSGGVDLDKYLGRWVEVSGDETKPESLRGETLVVVTQITAAR
jgi:hypothetical protein